MRNCRMALLRVGILNKRHCVAAEGHARLHLGQRVEVINPEGCHFLVDGALLGEGVHVRGAVALFVGRRKTEDAVVAAQAGLCRDHVELEVVNADGLVQAHAVRAQEPNQVCRAVVQVELALARWPGRRRLGGVVVLRPAIAAQSRGRGEVAAACVVDEVGGRLVVLDRIAEVNGASVRQIQVVGQLDGLAEPHLALRAGQVRTGGEL